MKSKEIVTTTLRLPKWLDEKLKEESEYKAISKNALILEKLRNENCKMLADIKGGINEYSKISR